MNDHAAACSLARRHDVSLHAAKAAHAVLGEEAASSRLLEALRDAGADLRRCPVTKEAECRCATRACRPEH